MAITNTRTRWSERHMEELVSLPFIAEFVFRSPKKLDPQEKEVADLMVVHEGSCLLISQKLQEDPFRRSPEKMSCGYARTQGPLLFS